MKKIFTLILLTATVLGYAQMAPNVSATTPSAPSAGVTSIFSDAYTDVAGTNFNPGWGQATVYSAFTVGSDNILKYATLNYQGIEFGSDVDAAAKGTLHMDIWSEQAVDLAIFCISRGAGSVTEASVSKTLVANQWNSVDINLSDYIAKGLSVSDLFQFKFDEVARTVSPTIYVDNIYFYGTATATEPVLAASNPTRPAANVTSIYSESYSNPAAANYSPGWGQTTTYNIFAIGQDSMIKYGNLNYQGIEFGETKDVSSMEFLHLDVWTANVDSLDVYPISVGSGEKKVRKALSKASWTSIDIALSAYTAQSLTMNDIHQIKIVDPNGKNGTIYVDNIYFYKVPVPMAAAPNPTRKATDVKSIYSESYTNPAALNVFPGWGQSTKFKVFEIGMDSMLEYSILNYQGIEFGETLNVSAMDSLHLDVWSTSVSKLEIYPISIGSGEKKVTKTLAANTWNRIDIALSEYTSQNLTMNDLHQFKFVDPDGKKGTIYMDNIYFYKRATNSVSSVSFGKLNIYPNPASDRLTFNIDANNNVINSISLVTLQGQIAATQVINATKLNETMNISGLEAGIYFLQIATDNGTYTHKVILK